jgi:apolipoprotein N-acyltransferase
MIAVLCAALSGVMFYLSQGLANVWVLAWVAPVPLLWLAYGRASRWQAFLATFAAFAAGQAYLVQCYYGGVLPIPVLALAVLGSSLSFVAAVLFARAANRRLPALAALFAFPALWTGLEYAVGLVSPHGSFGSLAYSQVSFPLGIQTASLFGLYAVTFLLCLFANALALILRRGSNAVLAGGTGLLICTLSFGFGAWRLAQPQGTRVKVAALANEGGGAYVKAFKTGDLAPALAVTTDYAAAVRAVAARGVKEVVTPEGSVLVTPAWRSAALQPLEAAAKETGVLIVAGVADRSPAEDLAIAFAPSGQVLSYAKRHLLLPMEARFTPGHKPGLISDGRAMTICKDMDFPRTIRADASHGIRLMAVPADDFGVDAWIHGRIAVMRGVENGFAVLRSAFNGLETISDAKGRVLATASVMRPGMITAIADVPLGPGPTLYTRIGDVFAWACCAVVAALAIAATTHKPLRPPPCES